MTVEPGADVRTALERARRQLAASRATASPREAALLLAHVLGCSEAQVLARSERRLAPDEERRYAELLERRAVGEPVAYLVGEREFYGRPFAVDPRVLIPRPETEHVVEAALRQPLPAAPRLLDVGTGSGCLAITLLLELPAARAVATDVSIGALAVARANARRLGASGRLAFVAGDVARGLDLAAFDLVVANPPYIATAEAESLPVEVREHEPGAALWGGADGLDGIRRLLAGLVLLRPGVAVVFEIGHGQAAMARGLLAAHGFAHEETLPDYAGIARVVIGRRASWSASKS